MSENRIKNVMEVESSEIRQLTNKLDYQILEDIISDILTSKNIFFTGCGTSAMAARKITHTFNVINISAHYLNPSDAVHGALGSVHSGDIVFFISKGGNTKELVSFVDNVISKQAKIICVTENENSLLAQKAKKKLIIKVDHEPDKFNMLATASTIAVISVFDAIAIDLMYKMNFSKQEFLKNHPSGAVGDKLKEEVKNE